MEQHHCKSCGQNGAGKFCSHCGQSYSVKRISMSSILHDVFHFFTHLEKGFGYTLKQLVVAPGLMQREYVEGVRTRYQKPFSMFFICASINALGRYWTEQALLKYIGNSNAAVATLRHEYQLLLLLIALPVLTLFTWLIFRPGKYNYAETGVLQLYALSPILLITIFTTFLRFIWRDFDTAYVELPICLAYWMITSIRFYKESKPWVVVVKSAALTVAFFLMIQWMENVAIDIIQSRH